MPPRARSSVRTFELLLVHRAPQLGAVSRSAASAAAFQSTGMPPTRHLRRRASQLLSSAALEATTTRQHEHVHQVEPQALQSYAAFSFTCPGKWRSARNVLIASQAKSSYLTAPFVHPIPILACLGNFGFQSFSGLVAISPKCGVCIPPNVFCSI